MTRIGLLRHGEVAGGARFRGHRDDPLTAAGWDQMWAALRGAGRWERVVSSPLVRCAAFARAFARRHGLPLALDERLMEMYFGRWEGRSAAALLATDAEALTRFWQDPEGCPPPGGEPLARFRARVLAAWRDVLAAHAGRRVLLVTHGGVIRVLLAHLRSQPPARLLDIEVGHGSLHRIDIDAAGARLVADGP